MAKSHSTGLSRCFLCTRLCELHSSRKGRSHTPDARGFPCRPQTDLSSISMGLAGFSPLCHWSSLFLRSLFASWLTFCVFVFSTLVYQSFSRDEGRKSAFSVMMRFPLGDSSLHLHGRVSVGTCWTWVVKSGIVFPFMFSCLGSFLEMTGFFFFCQFSFPWREAVSHRWPCRLGSLWGLKSSQMDRVVLRPPRVLGLPRALRGLLAEDVPGPTRRLAE